jgi:hypothetical protein
MNKYKSAKVQLRDEFHKIIVNELNIIFDDKLPEEVKDLSDRMEKCVELLIDSINPKVVINLQKRVDEIIQPKKITIGKRFGNITEMIQKLMFGCAIIDKFFYLGTKELIGIDIVHSLGHRKEDFKIVLENTIRSLMC